MILGILRWLLGSILFGLSTALICILSLFGFRSHKHGRHLATSLVFLINGEQVTHMTLKDSQTVTLTLKALDSKGQPATLANPPVWTLSDATLATLTAAADGLSAVITPLGPVGSFTVQASETTGASSFVSDPFPIDVVGGDAVSIVITAGTPVDA